MAGPHSVRGQDLRPGAANGAASLKMFAGDHMADEIDGFPLNGTSSQVVPAEGFCQSVKPMHMQVEDAAFWTEDLQALTFVSVPELQDEILVAGCALHILTSRNLPCPNWTLSHSCLSVQWVQLPGCGSSWSIYSALLIRMYVGIRYPKGGDSLSITKGIVSRVVMTRFTWATSLLGIQAGLRGSDSPRTFSQPPAACEFLTRGH